jgi:hypothetical protein
MHGNLNQVTQYRPFLQDAVYGYLRQCAESLEDCQHFASAVWAAVFLEAFLTDLLQDLNITVAPQTELNDLIQRLRQYAKNPPTHRLPIPDEIIKRCDDIRNTRNRLVHNTGVPKKTVREDAQFIYAGIQVILEWYQRTHQAKPQQSPDTVTPCLGFRMFISANTPDNARQSHCAHAYCHSGSNLYDCRQTNSIRKTRSAV